MTNPIEGLIGLVGALVQLFLLLLELLFNTLGLIASLFGLKRRG